MNKGLLVGVIIVSLAAGIGIGYFVGKGNASLPGAANTASVVKFTSGVIREISGSILILDSGWSINVSGVQIMKAGKPIAFSDVKIGMVVSVEFKKNFKPGNVGAGDVQSVIVYDANTGGPLQPGQAVVPPTGPYNPPK